MLILTYTDERWMLVRYNCYGCGTHPRLSLHPTLLLTMSYILKNQQFNKILPSKRSYKTDYYRVYFYKGYYFGLILQRPHFIACTPNRPQRIEKSSIVISNKKVSKGKTKKKKTLLISKNNTQFQ